MGKEELYAKTKRIEAIAAKNGILSSVQSDLNEMRGDLQEYACRIPVVGSFSAGKSAFLNRLLDQDGTLPENETPETTLAAELVYGTDEYAEAVDASGSKKRFALSEIKNLRPTEWRYLICHINSAFLKENPDIVLVDMPGLDSNIDLHNKAISQYVDRGSAFALMVGCDEGTVKNSTMNFLHEVAQYPQGIVGIVSKSDLRPESDTEKVCHEVQTVLRRSYGREILVMPFSVFDSDFASKASELFHSLDTEALFNIHFEPKMRLLVDKCVMVLNTRRSALELDENDIEARIQACQTAKETLHQDLEREKKAIDKKYRDQVIPQILNDVESALHSQINRLVKAASYGNNAFCSAVNSIIRPALYNATSRNIEVSFDEFLQDAESSANDSSQGFKDTLFGIRSFLENAVKGSLQDKSVDDAGNGIYTVVAGVLAAATNIVSPVIEVLIIMLPTLNSVLSKLFQRNREEEAKNRIEYEVIPQLMETIQPLVEQAVMEIKENVLDEIEKSFHEQLGAQEAALHMVLQEKAEKESSYEGQLHAIDEDIQSLRNEL